MRRILVVAVISLMGLGGGLAQADTSWDIQTVDSEGNLGDYGTSLALDSSGYPCMSYYDGTNGDLKYAYEDAGGWHIETVDGATSVAGKWSSLALDSSDTAHISYYDETNDTLRYGQRTGSSSWDIWDVHSGAGEYCSLALDNSDYPHISYHRGVPGSFVDDLYYAYYDGADWHSTELEHSSMFDTTIYGLYTSIALDSHNYPHISECRQEGGVWSELRYIYWDGSEWHSQDGPVRGITGEFDGQHTSIALDSNDVPHISYYYMDVGTQYATYDGSGWQVQTVDNSGRGYGTSIVMDSYPHISYYGDMNDDLKYGAWDGLSWDIQTVDSPGTVGEWTSLALDDYGFAHISYYDETNGDLKYANNVPEPTTLLLFGLGLPALIAWRRRKRF